VLALTRQTLFERHPDWMQGVAQHGRIDLKPLDNALSQELAEALLARIDGAPQGLRTLIVEGAEGNPFYMEELVKMLIDDGVIVVEAEGWRVVADRLQVARVPPTLTGVLQARLDALTPPERLALQQSAVVGHEFWDQALAAIDPGATALLPQLHKRELIVPRTGGGGEYVFRHHLLHQVTYDSVLKAPRRDGHAKVGGFWRLRAHAETPRDVDPAHCRALAQAHFHGCQADAKDYVGWFELELPSYYNAYASQTLRPLAEQLVEVCEREFGPEHPQTARALTDLARVELMQRDVGAVEARLRRALAIQAAALPPDHADTARTLSALGGYHESHGDLAAAEPYYERALEIRERLLGEDHRLTLVALDKVAKARFELGRLDEAELLFRRALATHERCVGPEHADTAFALTALGEVLAKKGEHVQAEPLIRRALEVQQRCLPADHPDTGLSMWHLGETLRSQQRHDEAETLARDALRIWEAAFGPDHEWTAWGLVSLAHTRLAQGDAGEAATLADRAGQLLQALFGGAHEVVADTRLLQARALLALGRVGDAGPLLRQVVDARAGIDDDALARAATELLTQARAGEG
jgi:tetratricopeptide (TPR) repeat protein